MGDSDQKTTVRHACPNGHHWEADGVAVRACPTCGWAAPGADAGQTLGFVGDAPVDPSLPTLPGYEILTELGRGGMGVVYKAREVALDRIVALKVILAGEYADAEGRRRLSAEAVTVGRLNHPNVVAIYALGEGPGGVPYFVMEYCAGGSLADKVGTPWLARDAAVMVETLARAMQAAHAAGIVHRDLKPANVLLGKEEGGRMKEEKDKDASSFILHPSSFFLPKIADFGLARREGDARQTASGAIMGTPAYMAPEQAAGKTNEIGPAADVWALGVILYELLAGKPPFHAGGAAETLVRILSDEPPPPRTLNAKIHRDLETIAMKCLHKESARRYASAGALADDLRRFLDGEAIEARPRRWYQRLSRRQRGWMKTGAVALAGALMMMGLLVGVSTARYLRSMAYGQAWRDYVHHRNAREYELALADLNEAHRLHPNEVDPLVARAWLHRQLEKPELALADYAGAIERDPKHAAAYRNRGHLLLVLRRYQEAHDDLTKSIDLDPHVSAAFINRANALMNLQRFAEAEPDLDKAIAFDGVPPEAYHNRAIARAARGRYDDCLREVDVLAGRAAWGRAEVWFSRAVVALLKGDAAQARQTRDRLMALAEVTADPGECALAARACVLSPDESFDAARAAKLVAEARQARPDDAFSRRVQAQVWLRAGKADEALAAFQALLKSSPRYSPGLTRLWICLAQLRLGHKDEARRAYDAAIADGVPTSHVHETLEYRAMQEEARRALAPP